MDRALFREKTNEIKEGIPMLNKKSVDDINVKGKRVLVRCDFNVPLQDRKDHRREPSGSCSADHQKIDR